MEDPLKNELDEKDKKVVQHEEEKEPGILENYYKSFQKEMEGKPWYIRHKSTLIILGLTALAWIFCAVWSHFFPYGIL